MVKLGRPEVHPGRVNVEPLRELHRVISDNPGLKRCELAEMLGWPWRTVDRRVDSLEYAGLLVSEDRQRRLYPFDATQEVTL